MRDASKKLAVAAVMTSASVAVVVRWAGMIWEAMPKIVWSRILILLLAALWGLSLVRAWVGAIYRLRRFRFVPSPAISFGDLQREGDV